MFPWRARRQLIALFIIAIPVVALGLLVAPKLLPEAACTDNRKNQGELGVDCGGPCASCELKNPRPPRIFWAKAVPARKGMYDAVAEVTNPNEALSSADLSYEFLLFDNIGLIAARQGKTFIFPNERLHIVETNLETSRIPVRVEFKIVNVSWDFKDISRPNLAVERHSYEVIEDNGRKQGLIEAEIVNRTPFDFRETEVIVVALDSAGNLLGANRIAVDKFISGSRRIVRSFWPAPFPGGAVKIEIEPRVNLFDPTAILKPK